MGQARLQNSAGCWTARSFDLARGTRVLVQIFRPIRNFIPGTGDLEARIASKRGANRRLNYLPATLTPFLRRLFTDETRRKAISPFYFPSGKGGRKASAIRARSRQRIDPAELQFGEKVSIDAARPIQCRFLSIPSLSFVRLPRGLDSSAKNQSRVRVLVNHNEIWLEI